VQIANLSQRPDGVVPSHDKLFTSGTLGRYSSKLMEVHDAHDKEALVAAD